MDKTISLTNPIVTTFCLGISSHENAYKYFKTIYPEIVSIPETDEFEYRGIRFDYFLSGIPIDKTSGGAYFLVDKLDSKIWLSTYGNLEDRWKDYLKNRN